VDLAMIVRSLGMLVCLMLLGLTGCSQPPAAAYRLMAPPTLDWAIAATMPGPPAGDLKPDARIEAALAALEEFVRRRERVLTVTAWLPYAVWSEGPLYPTLVDCETERLRWRRVSREWDDPKVTETRLRAGPIEKVLEELRREQDAQLAIFAHDIPMTAAAHARCMAVR
jgi:hypothetical protein